MLLHRATFAGDSLSTQKRSSTAPFRVGRLVTAQGSRFRGARQPRVSVVSWTARSSPGEAALLRRAGEPWPAFPMIGQGFPVVGQAQSPGRIPGGARRRGGQVPRECSEGLGFPGSAGVSPAFSGHRAESPVFSSGGRRSADCSGQAGGTPALPGTAMDGRGRQKGGRGVFRSAALAPRPRRLALCQFSWTAPAAFYRVRRNSAEPDSHRFDVGFRVLRELDAGSSAESAENPLRKPIWPPVEAIRLPGLSLNPA
jgi:hypothetical protein